jgi:hypothetical protein
LRVAHELRPHGIRFHIPENDQVEDVEVDGRTPEPPLKPVGEANWPGRRSYAAGADRLESVKVRGYCTSLQLTQYKVKVVWHQAVGMDSYRKQGEPLIGDVEKHLVVAGTEEQLVLFVSPVSDMHGSANR